MPIVPFIWRNGGVNYLELDLTLKLAGGTLKLARSGSSALAIVTILIVIPYNYLEWVSLESHLYGIILLHRLRKRDQPDRAGSLGRTQFVNCVPEYVSA